MNTTSTCRTRIRRTLLASALAVAAGAASAAVVTTPAGVVNGPFSDAPAFGVWQRIDIRATASVGITGDYPRNGDGSVLMTSGDGTGKTTWQHFPAGGLGPLSSFISATYEWYRDAASTVTRPLSSGVPHSGGQRRQPRHHGRPVLAGL